MTQENLNVEIYNKHGIKFFYPDDWELEETENEDGFTVILESPMTVTLTISILPTRPQPAEVLEQIVDIFNTEYEEVDVYDPVESSFGEYAVMTQELEFVCHELINLVKLTALRTYQFSLLMLSQGHDHDMEEYHSLLEKIFQSLELVDDDDKMIT